MWAMMMAQDIVPEDETVHEWIPDAARTDKRMKRASSRTLVFGNNPNVREAARLALEGGYHVSASGRNGVRILHFVGDCCMVPGLGYFRFQFMGKLLPSTSHFDGACKL